MTIIEIKDRESLRAGDIATFAYQGHEFTGPMWGRGERSLLIGSTSVRHGDGAWNDYFAFVRATREMPPLPTEPGAVILVTECRGERADEPVVAWWDDVEAYWTTPTRRFGGMTSHMPYHIAEWTPAKVVPA